MSPSPTEQQPGQATDPSFASSGNQYSAGPIKRDPNAGAGSLEYSRTVTEARRGPVEYALVQTGKVGAGSKQEDGKTVFNVEMEFTQGHRIEGAFKAGRLAEVLPDNRPLPSQFGALTPHRRLQDPKVRMFADFAVRELKKVF